MRVHESLKERFEELDEQRRRVDDDFNSIVQQMRSGSVRDDDRPYRLNDFSSGIRATW